MIAKHRSVLFVLVGVLGLLLKDRYTGPGRATVHAQGGNVTVSFAVYFLATRLPLPSRYKTVAAAVIALLAVELFEVTNGFGVMTNVYDSGDLVANVAGVVLAFIVDTLLSGKTAAPVPSGKAGA